MSYQIGDAKITKITEAILDSFSASALLPDHNPAVWASTGRITRRNGRFRWDFI
jgi:hypothetical protein